MNTIRAFGLSAVAAILANVGMADLSPTTIHDEIPGTATLQEIVYAGGVLGGVDTNAIKWIVNEEVGGTNEVKSVVSNVTANATNWSAKAETSITNGLATTDYVDAHTPGNYETVSNKAMTALQKSDVVNNLETQTTDAPLSANMGYEIEQQVLNLKQRGRYLSIWDAVDGLAETTATVSPYPYKTGDYFIVGTVAASGGTNYRPVGTEYTNGVPSRAVETGTLLANDTYYFDGTTWTLVQAEQKEITFASIAGNPSDNTNLKNALDAKQNAIADYTTTNAAAQIVTNNVAEWAMHGKAEPVTDLSSRTTFAQATNIAASAAVTNAGAKAYVDAQGYLTSESDPSVDATNPTFSNAVLAVGLNIDTNSVAVLNEIAATFGGFPIGGTATTVGGLLAALAAAIAWLKKKKRDRTDNTCHQTTSGFTPWRATLPSGYSFGDAQPTFDSTTSKWTWYVEGSGVAVDAESGASTASATSATFSFTDGSTVTFDAVRSSQPATADETFATADYVDKKVGSFSPVGGVTPTVTSGVANLSSLFSSDNTSYDAANINYTATGETATTVKAKIQSIETAVGTAAASLTTALGTAAS